MQTNQDFNVILSSTASANYYPDNKPQNFKTHLDHPLNLEGDWEVALISLYYPHKWQNYFATESFNVYILRDDENGNCKHQMVLYNYLKKFDEEAKSMDQITVEVPAGYYKNSQAMAEYICYRANREFFCKCMPLEDVKKELLTCNFDEVKDRIVFQNNTHCPLYMYANIEHKDDEGVLPFLGFNYRIDANNKIHRFVEVPSKGEAIAGKRSKLKNYDVLYVYSDIVSNQIVGDHLVPNIGVLPIVGEQGRQLSWAFKPPLYLPVRAHYISDIEILLALDSGEHLPLREGTVVCILNFRKCGLGV